MITFPCRHSLILVIALVAGLAACGTHQNNPQEVKEKTAQATADIKSDAKAVAQGIREGWNRDKPLNLNTATRQQLVELPGITDAKANKIVAGRPYDEPNELVARGILEKSEYDRIANQVEVKR